MADVRIWHTFKTDPPRPGDHIVILCNDGCSCSIAFVTQGSADGSIAVRDAEDAWPFDDHYLDGAIWAHIPDDYPIPALDAD